MVDWKRQLRNVCVGTIEEIVARECIRFVHVLWAVNGLLHGPNDNVGIDDCEIEDRFFCSKEVPSCTFGERLVGVVAHDWRLSFKAPWLAKDNIAS